MLSNIEFKSEDLTLGAQAVTTATTRRKLCSSRNSRYEIVKRCKRTGVMYLRSLLLDHVKHITTQGVSATL